MRLLLDTHAYVWHAFGDRQLPADIQLALDDPTNIVSVSIASFWEVGIKAGMGKWPMPLNVIGLQKLAISQSIDILPISVEAIHQTALMDTFNKDPFDRLIAATALIRGDLVVTIEQAFERWGVHRLW